MMKKMLLALCLVACSGPGEGDGQRLREIDRELGELRQQLGEGRKEEMREEIEGQAGMLGEYKEFVTKEEEAEKVEQADKKISERIRELEEEKQKILKVKQP